MFWNFNIMITNKSSVGFIRWSFHRKEMDKNELNSTEYWLKSMLFQAVIWLTVGNRVTYELSPNSMDYNK